MAMTSFMVPVGTPAPDFELRSVDGVMVRRDDFVDMPALLVAFLCNHCPYVRHIETELGSTLSKYQNLAVVGICSNDTLTYPEDAPEQLRKQMARAGWQFPYLIDDTQDVARTYRAACTPDFFLYGAERRLAYRGAFDGSTPGNGKPVTGVLLTGALDLVIAGTEVPEPHQPSMGCSIKWRSDNEPARQ
jgi:peroxiredoxin